MSSLQVTDPAHFPIAFDDALNRGDLERLLSLYEPDATFRAFDGSLKQGTEALQAELQTLMAMQAQLHNTLRHVMQSGCTALIVVDWILTLNVPGAGHVESRGTATNVLRYDAEQGWRMAIANSPGTA